IPNTYATLLVIYRPEYSGTLAGIPEAHLFALAPLSDSDIAELVDGLLGRHPSLGSLAAVIADRAAGIPVCVTVIVLDLAERGELQGGPGAYVCVREVRDIHVPASVQAIIGARIDRLGDRAKRTLHAAAVIGAQFDTELLEFLIDSPDVAPLIE